MATRLIHGYYHYCRKAVKLRELGIVIPMENIEQFELIQQYAHVYRIPMYPVEAPVWGARSRDGQLYEVGDKMKAQLARIPYSWTSILLAYLGPIIVFFICVISSFIRSRYL
jgi:hypothetical protein